MGAQILVPKKMKYTITDTIILYRTLCFFHLDLSKVYFYVRKHSVTAKWTKNYKKHL